MARTILRWTCWTVIVFALLGAIGTGVVLALMLANEGDAEELSPTWTMLAGFLLLAQVAWIVLVLPYGAMYLAVKSLRQHALSSTITAASIALGSGLLMTVFAVQQQTYDAFVGSSMGIDAVLGARGSKLQLVLNSIHHMEQSTGNIPWSMYQTIRRHPAVASAYPIMVGDNFKGFRLVGTVPELFTEHAYGRDTAGEPRRFAFARGELFDPMRAEAVLGSFAAQQLGMTVGSTFYSYHGLSFDESAAHDLLFTVVGVLEPTNTPADRAIWIPLEGYFRMPGHALSGAGVTYIPKAGQPIPDEHKEVSAVLLKLRGSGAGMQLNTTVNRQGNAATLAWPVSQVMADLFERVGWAHDVLTMVAILVVLVAAGSVLASIYNTMNERRREFAILRALGARRTIVSGAIVTESAAIAALGALLGFAVYAVLMAGVSAVLRAELGLVLDTTRYHPAFALTPVCVITLGALTGIVPAIKAYATDVATNLAPAT